MPTTPSITRSRTAAAMTSRLRDDQPTTSTDNSTATSSGSSSRGRGRGRGRGKRVRATNKDFSQQTLACKGCGQIGHTVLLCEEELTSNELALTCSDCTRTHTLNAAEKMLTTNTLLCPYHFNRLVKSAPADPETLRKAKFLVDKVSELQTATGASLANSLSWLGVPAEEYERCLQIAETEMM
ncbi:hypothetical protein ACHWQZ_G009993 [Mnemiopsis leidyi]